MLKAFIMNKEHGETVMYCRIVPKDKLRHGIPGINNGN